MKERIVECEQVILRTFVFEVGTLHPFASFLNYCKSLGVWTETVQVGWSIIVDSYVFGVRKNYSVVSVAIAALYLAIRMVNDPSPVPEAWWTHLDDESSSPSPVTRSTDELVACCHALLSMYG